uniref:Uncharacterized protein n=1 Tax=Vespula pensylvanica TaxID=30213 RepID=A0A834PF75_VESPE|nr:hypothetical protein H0235_000973 [Vespula pensylvanica]
MSEPNGSRKAAYRTSGNVSSPVEWFGAVLGYCAHETHPEMNPNSRQRFLSGDDRAIKVVALIEIPDRERSNFCPEPPVWITIAGTMITVLASVLNRRWSKEKKNKRKKKKK